MSQYGPRCVDFRERRAYCEASLNITYTEAVWSLILGYSRKDVVSTQGVLFLLRKEPINAKLCRLNVLTDLLH